MFTLVSIAADYNVLLNTAQIRQPVRDEWERRGYQVQTFPTKPTQDDITNLDLHYYDITDWADCEWYYTDAELESLPPIMNKPQHDYPQ